MSTVCKLAIVAPCDAVVEVLGKFLQFRAGIFDRVQSERPLAYESGQFGRPDEFPTVLSVKQVTDQVTEIHYNCFGRLDVVGEFLTHVLKTKAVINMYQSVTTASYWVFIDNGIPLRRIEAVEGWVESQSGDRLSFEATVPGAPRDDPDYMVFDREEQHLYNCEVGVPVEVYEDYDPGWLNFVAQGLKTKDHQKPWWRFW